ncbi:MAG: class I SAM-dependent methyltransferase [Defluviitaleaceae bacterium]|nr:class I SAM-dependent methyltransferase [Defluviitaleaceae bacterium]
MKYTETNKQAWEHAFENRKAGFGEENYKILNQEHLPFFYDEMKIELENIDFKNAVIAQFCCNNGRELLSLAGLPGVERVVGFDIAENIIKQARDTAEKAGITGCEFVACNILEIDEKWYGKFDAVLLTIGAICWFEDLGELFGVAAKCLKPDGKVLIHEIHPFENMLPMPGEEGFDPNISDKFAYSYFRSDPWIQSNGMTYMTGLAESKTFTSFSHTLGSIITALADNGLFVTRLKEHDYGVSGMTDLYDGKGIPLSYVMIAKNL